MQNNGQMAENKESLPFAYTLPEIARSLLVMETDSPEEAARKKASGFYYDERDGFSLEGLIEWINPKNNSAVSSHISALRDDPFHFSSLLKLVAHELPFLNEVGQDERAIRRALHWHAQSYISGAIQNNAADIIDQISREKPLSVEKIEQRKIKMDREITRLQEFQGKLLERATPTSPDISKK